MSNRVAVIDFGMCNLDSVRRAVEECGGSATVTNDPRALDRADRIILPGVGAFAEAMKRIRELSFDKALLEMVDHRVPLLGLCLGMQLLASRGLEGGETRGLGLVVGEVRRLAPTSAAERVPHVGWNEVDVRNECPLFAGVPARSDYYFVHSYAVSCEDEDVAATTPYCGGFTSAVQRGDAVFGVQFHPEKSQRHGLRLIENFLAI